LSSGSIVLKPYGATAPEDPWPPIIFKHHLYIRKLGHKRTRQKLNTGGWN
jgi:hypothetical protein